MVCWLTQVKIAARHLKGRQMFVIADQTVAALHGDRLRAGLEGIDQNWIEVPGGSV